MSTTVRTMLEAERESAKAAIGLALRQASHKRQERPDATLPNNPSPPTDVHAVGRVSHPTKPIRSVKSEIVLEPDQIQSKPPVRSDLPHRT